ncbi:MAG: tetratricopeptide repeat protein [Methylotenera sp.]|uniref:O-linked N-acetylglucosamine transferase, SPINDLY family protein n=1 Tax=Methylotenera sp. TaxID=2051956 RepID=UPI0024895FFA|nr:tetratricopeptide repeat protein [Methylotenera sp.]MDI1309521.1 tetratricopeptide repeat protein [Methylotenera sp.]
MQTSNENALKHYQQALLHNPKDTVAQINCGNLCVELKRYEEAAGYFRRLLRIFKNNENIRNALCYALQELGNESHAQGRYVVAEACFEEALQNQPRNAAYLYNLGNAQRELGKPKEAAVQYQKAIQLSPDDADIYNNLGNVQRELGLLDLAITSYQKALDLNPKLYHAQVHLVHQKQHICDWEGLEADISNIRDWVKNVPEAQISPFAFLAMPTTTAEEQKLCANNWVNNRYATLIKQADTLNFQKPRMEISHSVPDTESSGLKSLDTDFRRHDGAVKIKVGYLSADFRLHPLAFLISELIELHDRTAFEIVAFSYGVNDKSRARVRLEKAFDEFHDIRNLSEVDAAKKINALQIDILVDLTGFTQTSRSGIAALRPAPINVNWLGFPGTMGMMSDNKPLFDYILSDSFITPAETANHYAEQLALLPHCYQPNDRKRPIGQSPSRESCHLPEGVFVFCCFNQTFKITPEFFRVWMRLLKAVPNSVLWLLESNQWAKQNLINQAEKNNIAAERLIFAPRMSIADHLARHVHADLFLDTAPYNAHTTCSDALWMGLPVLTCVGETFAARVAGSLLSAADMAELITYSLEEYENKAVHLANKPTELEAIKQKLLATQLTSNLFDTKQFAGNLERIYQSMWQQYSSTSKSNDKADK